MGKKHHDKSSQSSTAETPTPSSSTAETPTTPTTKDTPKMSNETETKTDALATTDNAALATSDGVPTDKEVMKALAARLPVRYRGDVLMLKRPTPEDLFNAIEKLPDAEQESMLDLARKTRPKKQGGHTTKSGFQPTAVRVYQGTGNDPVRPQKMMPGEFYNAASVIMGEKFEGVVIHFSEGRTMWPQKDSGGDQQSKAPICMSLDRVEGSRYGKCAECPNAQKAYNMGGCAKDVTVTFIDKALTGIYTMQFSKTSFAAGDALVKILLKSENIWDRWVTFEVQSRSEKDYKWYVIKATPVSDPKVPANNNTPKHLHPIFEMLSKVVDADVYYPQLADIHDRSKNSTDSAANGGGSAPADTFDEKALLGTAATAGGDNPDYSKDV